MTKKITEKLNVEIGDSFKNDKIIFCFLLFSSNKFVEFLLVKLNSFFIKYEYKKKSKKNKKIIEISISLENYIMLKKELIFQFKKEELKFKFLYVLFKKKKLSINFFEENCLIEFKKEENLKIINKYISFILLIKNIFYRKFLFLFYFIFISLINNIKNQILKNISVNYTSSR